jgi:hypothetical protein
MATSAVDQRLLEIGERLEGRYLLECGEIVKVSKSPNEPQLLKSSRASEDKRKFMKIGRKRYAERHC